MEEYKYDLTSFYRLDLAANNPKQDNAHFHASVDDDNFAFDLINDVIRAFLAATEPDVQVRVFLVQCYLHS